MREAEESVEIWIARNEGFQNADKSRFDELRELLSRLSCNNEMSLTEPWSDRC